MNEKSEEVKGLLGLLVEISENIIKEVCQALDLDYNTVNKDDLADFIEWSGYLDEDFHSMGILSELWDDWLPNKRMVSDGKS